MLKESKPKEKKIKNIDNVDPNVQITTLSEGIDNQAYEMTTSQQINGTNDATVANVGVTKTNCWRENFNPLAAIDSLRVVLKKREFGARNIVILLLVMYFLIIGPAYGK